MERKTIDFWVGLFVVAGMGALLFLALRVGNLTSFVTTADTYNILVSFENIGGLKVRAPVKSAGVVVGRVADITLDTVKYEAVARLRIEKRFQFPKDTFASILTSGLLGEQYVGLAAGGDDKMLAEGDKLKGNSALILEDLIGKFLYNKAQEGGGKSGDSKSDDGKK